ncbi:hypothetical protein [Rhizobium sp. SAFR-030]|uniref:hypothetical protein n=1 Tax=Rhizobium sp. SAFR-030 TaxID=3387277 RepID=UPI003F815D89
MRHNQLPSVGGQGAHAPLLSNASLYRLTGAIAALALLTAGISFVGRWYGERLSLSGHTDSTAIHRIQVGADALALPANMIRFRDQRRDGDAERVNLYLAWPQMQGYSQPLRDRFDQLSFANDLLFLEISEATMSRDMSGRLEPIYARLFDGSGEDAGAGLTRHRLRPDSGYSGELVFTAPRNGRPDYVVRCATPAEPSAATSGDCQRDIHLGSGLSVLYRFSSTLLPQWDHIDAAIETFVGTHLVEATENEG